MSIKPILPQPDRDSHVMAIALAARLASRGDATPLTPARFWDAYVALEGDLLAASASEDTGIRHLAERRTAAALHAAEIEAQGIWLITPFHQGYPTRYLEQLGTNAPPLLYVAGDPTILAANERPRLAVVGSRDAKEGELDSARVAAEAAATRGWDVVSGGAKGVDAVALNAAAARGAIVIALLTEGVRRAMRKGALRRLVSDGQAVLVAPVHPDTGFAVGNAMSRNKLIYGLADVTYVAAVTDGGGGTWNGAVEALRRNYGAVAVNAHADAAHAIRDLGGRLIETPDELFEPGSEDDRSTYVMKPSPAMQVSLFD